MLDTGEEMPGRRWINLENSPPTRESPEVAGPHLWENHERHAEAISGSTSQAKEAYAKLLDLWKGAEEEMPTPKQVKAETAKCHRRGIRREVCFPGGPLSIQIADRALLLPR